MKEVILFMGCLFGTMSIVYDLSPTPNGNNLEEVNLFDRGSIVDLQKMEKKGRQFGNKYQNNEDSYSKQKYYALQSVFNKYTNSKSSQPNKHFIPFGKLQNLPFGNQFQKDQIRQNEKSYSNERRSFSFFEPQKIEVKNDSPYEHKLIERLLKKESPLFTNGNIISISINKANNNDDEENILNIGFSKNTGSYEVIAHYNKNYGAIDIKKVIQKTMRNRYESTRKQKVQDPLDLFRLKMNVKKSFSFPTEQDREAMIQKAMKSKQLIMGLQRQQRMQQNSFSFVGLPNWLKTLKNALMLFS